MICKNPMHIKVPDTTIENGLLRRWCRGIPGERFGHFSSYSFAMTCEDWGCLFLDALDFIGSRQSSVTKEESLEFLMHQAYCKQCPENDPSALFAPRCDIPKDRVGRLAELCAANYPAELQQPLFFNYCDRTMLMSLPETPDAWFCGTCLSLDTLIATYVGHLEPIQAETGDQPYRPGKRERRQYDLNQPEEWLRLLEEMPQPLRGRRQR